MCGLTSISLETTVNLGTFNICAVEIGPEPKPKNTQHDLLFRVVEEDNIQPCALSHEPRRPNGRWVVAFSDRRHGRVLVYLDFFRVLMSRNSKLDFCH